MRLASMASMARGVSGRRAAASTARDVSAPRGVYGGRSASDAGAILLVRVLLEDLAPHICPE